MGRSAYWQPLPQEVKRHSIGYLNWILKQEYWAGEEPTGTQELTSEDILFLQGVAAAGQEDVSRTAKELIAAIEKHGRIEILFV